MKEARNWSFVATNPEMGRAISDLVTKVSQLGTTLVRWGTESAVRGSNREIGRAISGLETKFRNWGQHWPGVDSNVEMIGSIRKMIHKIGSSPGKRRSSGP